MDRNEFIKKALEIEPASIEATVDKQSQKISTTGRAIDLLTLLTVVTHRIISNLPLSIEQYCEVLKMNFNQKKDDHFEKLFEDIFNEHR